MIDAKRVLYEDNHLIAINKYPGDLSQGDKTGRPPLGEEVKLYLKEKYNKPGDVFLGVIHRIDQPVSGVMLFARTSKALERMTRLIREREFVKTYWAVVKNQRNLPVKGLLKHYISRAQNKNVSIANTKEVNDSKLALLSYEVTNVVKEFSLLKIIPTTGRQHQIRVQLAKINCPIVGDVKYGYAQANKDASICLHAGQLEFVHPVKKEKLMIQCDWPEQLIWKLF